ncbi:low temperature requirement protein A [Lactobacillus johnsonii]|uniref:low temperature requirement protein A n=1 Tax=Lactobacillus johnsonii TaxID=33959 RepID=UPI0022E6A10A|nr:low temperature requirement protein A [Lactobacillus johnsonii]
MPNILTKRVSMIELFYDLVFAYMISQATSLIHHLQHGTISPVSFLIFAVIVIVFINSWMVQSVLLTAMDHRVGQILLFTLLI